MPPAVLVAAVSLVVAVLAFRAARAAVIASAPGGQRFGTLLLGSLAVPLALTLQPLGLVLGGQAFLATLGMDPARDAKRGSRLVLPALGHLTLLVATWSTFTQRALGPGAAIAFASGFTILALHAFWTRTLAAKRDPAGWETVMLVGVMLVLAAGMLEYVLLVGALRWLAIPRGAVAPMAAAGALVCLAVLADPPRAPRWLRSRDSIVMEVLAHGVAGTALVNVFFLAYSLVASWSVRAILALILLWSLVGVHFEWRNVLHFRRALRRGDVTPTPIPMPDAGPIDVVVPAANEAAILRDSIEMNLAVGYPLRFVLVPAVGSRDDTMGVARALVAEHPDRVRVVEGTTGSKAEDLNLAWGHVGTELVLILDADEVIEEVGLAYGVRAMLENPDAGIVMGRKVSRDPEGTPLARFIGTERRYSTGMDTVMHAQQLGSTHFGGSAALLRRDAPRAIGMWTTLSMTEDIDLTMRAHLADAWRIHYEPRMLVREADPRSFGELLKQRTRWSRGWIQCVDAYLPGVIKRRKELGARRAMGLAWMLLTCIAALWTTLFPATVLLRLAGLSLLMPVKIVLLIALLMLPARMISYGYGALHDPVLSIPRSAKRFGELVLHAYLWILFGWVVSIHALYLELFSAPRVWYVTGKGGATRAPPRPAAPPARSTPRPH